MSYIVLALLALSLMSTTLWAEVIPAKTPPHAKLGSLSISGTTDALLTVAIHDLPAVIEHDGGSLGSAYKVSEKARAGTYRLANGWITLDFVTTDKIKGQAAAMLSVSSESSSENICLAHFKKSDFITGEVVKIDLCTVSTFYTASGASIRDTYSPVTIGSTLKLLPTGVNPSRLDLSVLIPKSQ